MTTLIDKSNVMREVGPDVYRAANGFSARREEGITPDGNPVGQRWVLRDENGAWVDVNQYRHDLFEHHGLCIDYEESNLACERRSRLPQ